MVPLIVVVTVLEVLVGAEMQQAQEEETVQMGLEVEVVG